MIFHAVFAAALAAGAPSAAADAIPPEAAARCTALAAEGEKLRGELGAARSRKAAGFLAGVAGRALVYAPGVDLGDSRLAQYAGQEVESAIHGQASEGLDKVRGTGKGADATSAKARLKAIEAESAKLSCRKA
ncbi:hypothetical protein LJR164_002259 [Phenylobacterium sp. LjRoot164]|uniref:hypothetical protein n=1 Tax=unclassified Phenylobacterium TaxID=2640670 RepID=UPI003ECD1A24